MFDELLRRPKNLKLKYFLIKDAYNHETLLEARKLEKLEIQLAKSRTAKIFNLRCLANKVTPKPLQIKWKGNKFEQAIINKAECSLIHNRIKCTNIKIDHLQTEIANTKTSLQHKLDEPTFTNLQNTVFNSKDKTFLQYTNTEIKKLKHLIPKWPPRQPTLSTLLSSPLHPQVLYKWVINLSKKELTPEENSLLQKGPKFAVTPATIPIKEYICITIVAALQAGELNNVDCSGLYHDINIILNTYTYKHIYTDITKAEHLALENLREDKDHIIVTADKGVALVVMDKTENIINVKPSYKTTQFTSISTKMHLQLSTKNSLKFCKTTRITISSLKQNTLNLDLMVPIPQQQDFMVFSKCT